MAQPIMEEINQGLLDKASSNNIDKRLVKVNGSRAREIVTKLQDSINLIDYIIINPGALTHTSIAELEIVCLENIGVPFYEVHISNIFAREEFRHKSFFSDIANGVILGLGTQGYDLALESHY